MIPIADENPTYTKPYVVYVLIILNVLVYAVDRIGAQGPFGTLYNWSMVPYALIHNTGIVQKFPVAYGPVMRVLSVPYHGLTPMWLTMFSSMFMHGSLMHIGGNMLYLWIFGNNIEDVLGHGKFVVFYLVCGVLAALAHVFSDINSQIPTVGASGAIAGVLGAYLLLYPGANVRSLVFLGFFVTFAELPAAIVLGVWFLVQLTGVLGTGMEVGGGVAYWAHIGGFIAGAVIIYLLGGRNLRRRRRYTSRSSHRPYPFRPWQ